MSDRETGKIKWYNPKKRYGFIIRENGDDLFFHQNSIVYSGFYDIRENVKVEFEVMETPKGLAASNIKVVIK